jgi:hypothetical protein
MVISITASTTLRLRVLMVLALHEMQERVAEKAIYIYDCKFARLKGAQFLVIALAKKVVVNCVGLYMVVIRIGDAAENIRFQASRLVLGRSRIVVSGCDRMGRSSASRVPA